MCAGVWPCWWSCGRSRGLRRMPAGGGVNAGTDACTRVRAYAWTAHALALRPAKANNCSKGETRLPHVNYQELEVGTVYAIRPEHGIHLEPCMFIGRTLYEFAPGDPRNYRRPCWAQPSPDGWWR